MWRGREDFLCWGDPERYSAAAVAATVDWPPMSERRTARPETLGDVLAGMFAGGDLGAGGVLLRLRSAWPDAAGATLAAHSRPIAWRDGAVVIEVDHPVVSQDLKLEERRVLDALRVKAAVDARELKFAVAGRASSGAAPSRSGGRR